MVKPKKPVVDYNIVLYHVTPTDNTNSIVLEGLNPRFSQGKQHLVWVVSKWRITWAIAHCAARHRKHIEELSVVVVDINTNLVRRTHFEGVFVSPHILQIEGHSEAVNFLDPETDDEQETV